MIGPAESKAANGEVAGAFDAAGAPGSSVPSVSVGRVAASSSGKAGSAGHGDVAHVLRKAFQAAVDETVPDEMLDLLAKLS